ncbi:aquaporin, putative [Eimeria maxima]|uniref:Aquaporin, putative n=1 Tax=Eimeria maxima TaxID=5804 RepID=U6MFL6_EIMMA|nr:aquaporin, putative [Eimeria maxima]CDJ61254.1 aquaporin, putative [Eimeria maxima]
MTENKFNVLFAPFQLSRHVNSCTAPVQVLNGWRVAVRSVVHYNISVYKMSSQKPALGEFTGCSLLMLISGSLPLLKVEGLDFPAALSLTYGSLLLLMRDAHVKTLNPALTLVDVLRNQVETGAGLMLILCQFAGAAVGAFGLSVLVGSSSQSFPASVGAPPTGQLMVIQLVFGAALAFAYIRGGEGGKYDGPWLGALMYGSFVLGGEATAFLNPAVALGANVCRGISGMSTNEATLATLVFLPLLAAGLAFLLDRVSEQHLQMSELVGCFFLSFGLLAAAAKGSTSAAAGPAAVGFAFYAAAIVRMASPASGGSLNPAVTGGALLSESRSISKDVATVWLFQLCGAAAAALLLGRVGTAAGAAAPAAAASIAGDWQATALSLGVSALLMIAYCTDFGDFFGSPAAAFIGAVYGLSLMASKAPLPINPAVTLGAAAAVLFKEAAALNLLEMLAEVALPFGGCICGAALLRLIPSEYKRRL